jgi:polyketide cyclase/dehydrase/lipid transport protein
MSVEVIVEKRIGRPRARVAEVMFDPKNDAAWTSGVISARPLTVGRHVVGSRVQRDVRFMGRSFGYEYRVTVADDDRSVEMEVDQPFPMKIRYELEDVDGGTLARIRARGEPAGFFRIGGPIMRAMVRRNIGKDLRNLKELVERQ